jgi:hypothetical protein
LLNHATNHTQQRWQILKMTPKSYIVNLTSPWRLLALLTSIIGFFGLMLCTSQFILNGQIGGIIALTISIILFVVLKRKAVRQTTIGLNKRDIVLPNKSISFKDIEYYKTHRMRGAGLKLKLMNGETVHLSSNANFCNSSEFIRFVNDFENTVSEIPEIRKVYSFGETKFGLYFAIGTTTFLGVAIAYQLFTETEIIPTKIPMIIVALTAMWSGIEIKKHLPTRAKKS